MQYSFFLFLFTSFTSFIPFFDPHFIMTIKSVIIPLSIWSNRYESFISIRIISYLLQLSVSCHTSTTIRIGVLTRAIPYRTNGKDSRSYTNPPLSRRWPRASSMSLHDSTCDLDFVSLRTSALPEFGAPHRVPSPEARHASSRWTVNWCIAFLLMLCSFCLSLCYWVW